MKRRTSAFKVGLLAGVLYLAASVGWILYSDHLARSAVGDVITLSIVQTWKGLAFVTLSALLFGGLVWWFERRQWRDALNLRQALRRDQAARRVASELLEEAEERFQQFLDNSPLLAWMTDHDRQVTWASRGLRFATRSRGEPVGQRIDEVFGEDGARRLWNHTASVIDDERSMVSVEPLALSDTDEAQYVVHRFPVGDSIGFVALDVSGEVRADLYMRHASATDLTEQLRAELDSFVYAISHDLRAPLRSLTGFSGALVEEYHDKFDADGKRYLDRIADAAELMGAQVDGLLELSRVNRAEMAPAEFDVAECVRTEVRRLSRADPDREVTLDVPERLVVTGDPNLLRQAFRHLVDNALKFTAGRKTTRIGLVGAEEDGRVTVTLSDNGAGFDMVYAHKLFTPFQRLHGIDEFPGVGIGLVIVQRIIQRHGGTVRLESRIGEGTAVAVTMGAKGHG